MINFWVRQWNDVKGSVKAWLVLPVLIAASIGLRSIWHKLSGWEHVVATGVFLSGWVVLVAVVLMKKKDIDPATGRPRINRKGCEYRHPYWYDKKSPNQPLCPRCFISHEKIQLGDPYTVSGMECRRCVVCKETITSRGCLTT